MRFKEALHFRLRGEATGRKTFKAFRYDRRKRLDTNENATATGTALIAIAYRCVEHPKAVQHARAHSVLRLLAILLALVLRDGCKKVLDEHAIGIFAELDRGRFQHAPSFRDVSTKFKMRFNPASQTADVVDDDDVIFGAVLFDEGQHRQHSGTVKKRAGRVIAERADDIMSAISRIFAASRFLGVEAVAFLSLSLRADTAVDDCLLV